MCYLAPYGGLVNAGPAHRTGCLTAFQYVHTIVSAEVGAFSDSMQIEVGNAGLDIFRAGLGCIPYHR